MFINSDIGGPVLVLVQRCLQSISKMSQKPQEYICRVVPFLVMLQTKDLLKVNGLKNSAPKLKSFG